MKLGREFGRGVGDFTPEGLREGLGLTRSCQRQGVCVCPPASGWSSTIGPLWARRTPERGSSAAVSRTWKAGSRVGLSRQASPAEVAKDGQDDYDDDEDPKPGRHVDPFVGTISTVLPGISCCQRVPTLVE